MTASRVESDVPEIVLFAEKVDESSFVDEIRILAALILYGMSQTSSDRAAELAGIPQVEFSLKLEHYKVFPLEAELINLEHVNMRT